MPFIALVSHRVNSADEDNDADLVLTDLVSGLEALVEFAEAFPGRVNA